MRALCVILPPIWVPITWAYSFYTIKCITTAIIKLPKIITASSKLVKDLIVRRLASSRKGDNGVVLVVGGSRIYHGAPLLASMAALRSGTDLVYTAVPKSNIISVRSFSPNIIALPLHDDKLSVGSANRIAAMIPKKPDTAAIGMGMSIAKPEAIVAKTTQK